MAQAEKMTVIESLRDPGAFDEPEERSWRHFALCFASLFLLAQCFSGPPGAFPGGVLLIRPWQAIWHRVVPFVGRHGLHLAQPITIFPSGSGDTTYNWVEQLCFLVVAALGAVVWSRFGRTRDDRLYHGLRTYLRYFIAAHMFVYGFDKLCLVQFSRPEGSILAHPIGDFSPFMLLWTFMGVSAPYQLFGGAAEVLGAILLLSRRTTTLGALIVVGVLGNVVMLNFCFDVPVKLFSSTLLVMALILAAHDAPRLIDFFIRGRATAPPGAVVAWRFPRACLALKIVAIGWMLFGAGKLVVHAQRMGAQPNEAPDPLAGEYAVEAQMPQTLRWRSVIMDGDGLELRSGDDELRWFKLARDGGTLALTEQHLVDAPPYLTETGAPVQRLSYTQPDEHHLVLAGTFAGQPLRVTLYRRQSTGTLLRRGFHLVNETPYVR